MSSRISPAVGALRSFGRLPRWVFQAEVTSSGETPEGGLGGISTGTGTGTGSGLPEPCACFGFAIGLPCVCHLDAAPLPPATARLVAKSAGGPYSAKSWIIHPDRQS